MRTTLSFDDVLLVPKHNTVRSRKEVDLGVNFLGMRLTLPVLSANMPSITGDRLAAKMAQAGGLGIIHRMCSVEEQADMVRRAIDPYDFVDDPGTKILLPNNVGAAIGIGDDWLLRATACVDAGASVICLDVAHGDQRRVVEVAREFLKEFDTCGLIVGNIATAYAAGTFLTGIPFEKHHRVALKCGVGGGSACSTRVRTGFGIPTLQSVLDVVAAIENSSSAMSVIADGGIKNSGDIVKCLAAGADTVMLGSMLAGTRETPGDVIKDDKKDRLFKVYRGSASYGAKKDFFGEAEYIEGTERLVEYKGSVSSVLAGISDGIRSGFTYCGAHFMSEFQAKAEFVGITPAGFRESLPHGLLG